MIDLQATLARMLHSHRRTIEHDRIATREPTGVPFKIAHASAPPAPTIPSQPVRERVGDEPLKPIHLINPDIIRSYNANRMLGENERAYVEHRSITWNELQGRRYERHERY